MDLGQYKQIAIIGVPFFGVLALLFAAYKAAWVSKKDAGTAEMQQISGYIQEGAMAFLKREYSTLSIFVVCVAALLLALGIRQDAPFTAAAFLYGAFSSALAGYFGMKIATKANVRTAQGARTDLTTALGIAFSGGSVMGMCVVGLGVLGLGILYLLFGGMEHPMETISGFGLGASSIALFARVGGGIYTKAADVGADLVGKVEAGIPEDDARNPAVVADLVGDNVGDVAGMGADLFESYCGSIIAAMVLGYTITNAGVRGIMLPLILACVGIVASILGTFIVKTKEGGNPQSALNNGSFLAGILMIVGSYFTINLIVGPEGFVFASGAKFSSLQLFLACISGLVAGTAIGLLTEYYTAESKGPAQGIAQQSKVGTATNIISGLSVGMMSTALPVVVLAIAVILAYVFGGMFGIALAGLGMLSTTGIVLAVDAYGPIADNSGGIAEMTLSDHPEVRKRTDKLDAVGNTTAAIGKGFAIGSAALTALALFGAFTEVATKASGITTSIDIMNPYVTAGLLLGAMLPFLFSSMAMKAVGDAAFDMIEEVRRQFKTIPELAAVLAIFKKEAAGEKVSDAEKNKAFDAAKGKPEYGKCVAISTSAAIKRMVVPGLIAVASPLVIGIIGRLIDPAQPAAMLGGLLAGVTSSGVLMAIFMANTGGAWDNAKKFIEAGGGNLGGKGSDAHKAAVVGDTVGDPFKDTAGPSLNILIKLMAIVSLVFAPFLFG
ncbi:MAG TPA: sodium-translocating pyrophosphatase [bacterium]|nr:sodium-translocating pyrophosphatase [bacterium]